MGNRGSQRSRVFVGGPHRAGVPVQVYAAGHVHLYADNPAPSKTWVPRGTTELALAPVVDRGSPPGRARIGHGHLLIRSSNQIGQ